MPHIKPMSKVLELDTYAGEKTVLFKLVDLGDSSGPTEVRIPISIAYRLYYLGRAFDGQKIKMIKPEASTSVDFVQLQTLMSELAVVDQTVIDPVSKHYLGLLLPMLASSRRHPGCRLIVTSS